MRKIGLLLCALAVALPLLASDEDDVRAARTAVIDAAKVKNRAALETWIADDFTFIHARGSVLDRAQYLAETTARGTAPSIETTEEKLTMYGGHTAVFVSRATTKTAETETNVRSTQIFIKRDGRWLWILGQSTLLPARPAAASIDPKQLDAYPGIYRLKAGRIIVVQRKGDQLFVEISGRRPGELIPRGGDEFVWFNPDANVDATFTFVRDANGRANEIVFRQDGREGWRAQRAE
jgi:hypothetical protein